MSHYFTTVEWRPLPERIQRLPIFIHFYKPNEYQPHETMTFHDIHHNMHLTEATRVLINMQVPQDEQQHILAKIYDLAADVEDTGDISATGCAGYFDVTITRCDERTYTWMDLRDRINELSHEVDDLLHDALEEEDSESDDVEMATFQSMEMYAPMSVPASKSAVDELEKVRVESVECGRDVGVCSICWEEFEVGSEATRLPCKHLYHGYCVVKWLEISNQCPLCRFELPPLE